MSNSSARWYVIQCKPRQESRALEHLQRQEFSCYFPRLRVEKLRQGRRLEIEEPLFPGYLFIRLDDVKDNWQPIRSTRGVIQLVRFNEHPIPVCDEIVETIRERLAGRPLRMPYLRSGDRVLITAGVFANLEASFIANEGMDRVVLLLNIIHSEQILSFPVAAVRKCANDDHAVPVFS